MAEYGRALVLDADSASGSWEMYSALGRLHHALSVARRNGDRAESIRLLEMADRMQDCITTCVWHGIGWDEAVYAELMALPWIT